ncbi:iron reductase domain protein [Amniculicola lignicola CBS 123094]|uniref:Iron reductase domain protein n=1 Tax=Amniculicola lignicola CBS 123094 TaxID=1392246 RepID=A0A6A5VX92_9PLEO|nr:iron reductase domain protein [Amniculicola lignicola CBS 123094]
MIKRSTTTVSAQSEASKYYDTTSGITYSSITHNNGVTYRVALPENGTVSDAILQIVSPNSFAWCGFAWGGHMTQNPLSVGWATRDTTGQQAIISSRIAYGYYAVPYPNENAEYTYLQGTTANETHWQVTTRCQGCTKWSSADGDFDLHTQTEAVVAYACSSVPPEEPKNNGSLFNIHEQFGIWSHDLTIAKNGSFAAWVVGNKYEQ